MSTPKGEKPDLDIDDVEAAMEQTMPLAEDAVLVYGMQKMLEKFGAPVEAKKYRIDELIEEFRQLRPEVNFYALFLKIIPSYFSFYTVETTILGRKFVVMFSYCKSLEGVKNLVGISKKHITDNKVPSENFYGIPSIAQIMSMSNTQYDEDTIFIDALCAVNVHVKNMGNDEQVALMREAAASLDLSIIQVAANSADEVANSLGLTALTKEEVSRADEMVQMGILRDNSTTFVIPANLDLVEATQFAILQKVIRLKKEN